MKSVAVGQDGRGGRRYSLSVNPAERDALQAMLNSDPSRTVTCGGGLMETTPEVLPMAELDFAHFANGGGITSDLVFVNVGTHPILPALYFYDKEGHLIAAESVVEITGALEIQEDGSLSVQTEMETLGELTISTHGRGEVVTGSVRVFSDGPIGGVLRFDLPGIEKRRSCPLR